MDREDRGEWRENGVEEGDGMKWSGERKTQKTRRG